MKWIYCKEDTLPPIDDYEDYPKNYILRCHCDGWRGDYEVKKCTAEEMRNIIKGYDWCLWLDESVDYEKTLQDLRDKVKELDKALATAIIFITQT